MSAGASAIVGVSCAGIGAAVFCTDAPSLMRVKTNNALAVSKRTAREKESV
jgi:hypothetical protein